MTDTSIKSARTRAAIVFVASFELCRLGFDLHSRYDSGNERENPLDVKEGTRPGVDRGEWIAAQSGQDRGVADSRAHADAPVLTTKQSSDDDGDGASEDDDRTSCA